MKLRIWPRSVPIDLTNNLEIEKLADMIFKLAQGSWNEAGTWWPESFNSGFGPELSDLNLLRRATPAIRSVGIDDRTVGDTHRLMGGIATAAYFDLASRSCPPGLQGTRMMLVDGVLALSARGGDRLGTWIYSRGKANRFLYCIIDITAVYALIIASDHHRAEELDFNFGWSGNPAA